SAYLCGLCVENGPLTQRTQRYAEKREREIQFRAPPKCLPNKRNRFYNAPRLLMPVTPQKRLVAALLPFSFLWVLIACVSICEREALAVHPSTDLSRSAELNAISDVHDCEGCPLSYFPKASMPERARSIIALDTVSGI